MNAYRDGRVHVLADRCGTCVFRPGNLMHLLPGRVRGMVRESQANESAIICHETLCVGLDNAVCRGFFDRYKTQPLRVAERLGLIEYDPVPELLA